MSEDFYRLNFSSMRWVTTKPPTTLIVARITAKKPRNVARCRVPSSRGEQGPDESDAGDGVRAGHQRGVQRRRNLRDDLNSRQTRPARRSSGWKSAGRLLGSDSKKRSASVDVHDRRDTVALEKFHRAGCAAWYRLVPERCSGVGD